jgi:[acyl-carrier-protein] S-malonyltransferase
VECGTGKVLTGMARRVAGAQSASAVGEPEDLAALPAGATS